MKIIFLTLGMFAIAFISISATSKKQVTTCIQLYYWVDRYVCGDVLVSSAEVVQGRDCSDKPVVIVNQENHIPLPCTHLHPPGGRY